MFGVSLFLQSYPCLDGRKVIHRPKFHTPPQLHFKADPWEIRKFHVILLEYVQRLLSEHDLLGQRHICDYCGLFLSHRAASHGHNGKLIDEPAVSRLNVTELGEGNGFADLTQQVVNLPLNGPHLHLRIEKTRGANDLLGYV